VDPGRVWELGLLRARSQRMVNDWAGAEDTLAGLDAVVPEQQVQVRAEIVMLRAEIALCGPVQDTTGCIGLCERVVGLSSEVELVSRAFGHRGLAHLAAYDPGSAQLWLGRAIGVAREQHHPYAEYEALHWLSKKKMACLELEEAWDLLEALTATSQASGVASDMPFHLRDASRVLGLRGDPGGAAVRFAQFFDLSPVTSQDRVVTILACQVAELETVHDRRVGDRMLSELATMVAGTVMGTDRQTTLTAVVDALTARPPGWAVLPFAIDVLGAQVGEAVAAEALFRFDVADLARLRRQGGQGAT
jgi:hypothetical protein